MRRARSWASHLRKHSAQARAQVATGWPSADAVVALLLLPNSAATLLQAYRSSPGTGDCGFRDPVLRPVRAGAARDCAAPRGRAGERSRTRSP